MKNYRFTYALGNVGQSGYPRYPSNYPYQSGYPIYYYLQYAAPVNAPTVSPSPPPLPSPQPQILQTQQKPPAVEQFSKQAVQYERPTTPTPPKPLSPVGVPSISYPVSSSSWQSYMCSVFPYLPSCQAQAQPAPLFSGYGYGSYPGYPGYQQMAQYPVYYIVQSDTRPTSNLAAPPGTVGIIKISGPTTIKSDVAGKPQPVETDAKETGKPQDVKANPVSNGDSVQESSELSAHETRSETTKQPDEKDSSSE
ncbi:unnamed protein product [Allacma fusca]|uniref:Uncharacterized protein n=1 Tax=Allacma fusca TaxID=39272 RepID=A0A8J2JW54_9HEXA|nr:unnamed protein product [Allacma fusca]